MWMLWDELYVNEDEYQEYEDPYLYLRLGLFVLIAVVLIYLAYKISRRGR
jgi:hypothetical protein